MDECIHDWEVLPVYTTTFEILCHRCGTLMGLDWIQGWAGRGYQDVLDEIEAKVGGLIRRQYAQKKGPPALG